MTSLFFKAGLANKPYPFETQKGLAIALEPPVLGLSALKHVVLSAALVAQNKLKKEELSKVVAKGVYKDSVYMTTRSALQIIAGDFLNKRLAHKLMKDVPASAIRKMDRYGQKGTVAARIFKTASLGCFLQFLAVFLVEEAYLYCSKANEGKSKEELRKETRKQAMAMVAGIFGQAVGSSVGSLIKPGQGTYVGGLVGATLADLIDFEAVDNKIMAGR